MKSYTVKVDSRSEIANALCSQLAEGKSGEILIRNGFSQANFIAFLSRLAFKAIAAGYDEAKLAQVFKQVAAGNASQARQACADIVVEFAGDKPQSLGKLWGTGDAKVAPDLSLLGEL